MHARIAAAASLVLLTLAFAAPATARDDVLTFPVGVEGRARLGRLPLPWQQVQQGRQSGARARAPTPLQEQDTINIGEFVLRVRWKPLR